MPAFTVVVEPADEGMWHAYCLTLLAYGAATWGATREEVLGHIREMAGMIVERLAEEGASVPIAPRTDQEPVAGERIVVTVRAPLRRRRTRRSQRDRPPAQKDREEETEARPRRGYPPRGALPRFAWIKRRAGRDGEAGRGRRGRTSAASAA